MRVGGRCFFLYKGGSISYGYDDDNRMYWRPVGRREFGECVYPINRINPQMHGTVSLDDSDEWLPI